MVKLTESCSNQVYIGAMYSHYLVATNDNMRSPTGCTGCTQHPTGCAMKTISYTNVAFLNILTKSAVFKYFSNTYYLRLMFFHKEPKHKSEWPN